MSEVGPNFAAMLGAVSSEWCLLGGRIDGGGVVVVASKDLRRAQMVVRYAGLDLDKWGMATPGAPSYDTQLTMRDLVYATAASYREALASLFERWSPERDGLDSGEERRQIGD